MNKTTYIVVILAIAVVIIFISLGFMGFNLFGTNASPSASSSDDTATLQSIIQQLKQNGGVTQLQSVDIQEGSGDPVQPGDTVDVLYTGMLPDGTVFDASSLHGNQPFSFTVGTGYVIKGWDQGLVGMKAGGRRVLVIPPELGYGSAGMGKIPPNATLIFEVVLVDRAASGAAPAASGQ